MTPPVQAATLAPTTPARRRSIRTRAWLRRSSLPVEKTIQKSTGEQEVGSRRRLSTLTQSAKALRSWPSKSSEFPRLDPDKLLSTSFDVLSFTSEDLLHVSLELFRLADVLSFLGVSEETIRSFLIEVRHNMRNNPYHNWFHCVDVAQAVVSFGTKSGIFDHMPPLDKFASLVAAFCHDLDHPGNKGAFGDSHGSVVALFGWNSLFERRHVFVAGQILSHPNLCLQSQLGTAAYLQLLDAVGNAILATDIEKHSGFMHSMQRHPIAPDDYRRQMCFLLKIADLSNVARPQHVSYKWAWRVSEEILLPPNTPTTPAQASALIQTAMPKLVSGFIENVALKFYRCAAAAYPALHPLAERVDANLKVWGAGIVAGNDSHVMIVDELGEAVDGAD